MTNHPVYSRMALADLLDAFSSAEPVPGGGSAAALAGALGASLLLMVTALPRTKTGTADEAERLAAAASHLLPLRDLLLEIVQRDSAAYGQVMIALRLPKESEAEQAARKQAIDAATRQATEVPLETMRASRHAIGNSVIVAAHGNRNAASDVGVAIELLSAALRAARLNIDINLKGMEAGYATRVREEASRLERDAAADADLARQRL